MESADEDLSIETECQPDETVKDETVENRNHNKHGYTDWTLTAVYKAVVPAKVNLTVTASSFTVSGNRNTQKDTQSFSYDAGSKVTVKFTDKKARFKGWVDENGKVLSRSKEYTFKLTGDKTVKAVTK